MMNSADVLAYRSKIDITDIAGLERKAYAKDTSMRRNNPMPAGKTFMEWAKEETHSVRRNGK